MLDEFYAGLITIMVYQPGEEQMKKLIKLFGESGVEFMPSLIELMSRDERIYLFGEDRLIEWGRTGYGFIVVDLDTFLDSTLDESVITEEEMLSLLE